MSEGGLDRRLQDFGFSDKEAAVYRSLLQLGEAKPSEIASAANVSTRYVYAVGERLESRGFVTVNDHVTPTVMRALPPDEVIEGLQNELSDLESALRSEYDETERAEMRVEVIKTTMTLRRRLRTQIDRASEWISLCIPTVALADIGAELREARNRGVLVMLALGRSTGTPDVEGMADLVRITPEHSVAMASVDNRCGIVATADMLERSNTLDRAILCADHRLGQLIHAGFMGTVWMVADEHYVRDPSALPETYSRLQPAIIDATLHQRQGTSIGARVEGVSRNTGDRVELTGPVVDIRQSLVAPPNGRIPTEATLVVDSNDGRVPVGTSGFSENGINAESVQLVHQSGG